jgi:hypothetical protein
MNGLELLQRLSQDPLYQNIPAIIVSTEGATNDAGGLGQGAKGFIKKPFLPEDIKRVLHDVIGVGADGGYQMREEILTTAIFEVFEKMFYLFAEPLRGGGGNYQMTSSIRFEGPSPGPWRCPYPVISQRPWSRIC